jgi:arabinan endo-1,5-alpha-L-arabinosidase
MHRRGVLHSLLAGGAAIAAPARGLAQAPTSINARLSGDISPVHDPCIAKEQDTYYLFCTGNPDRWGLIPIRTSKNLTDWTWRGAVLAHLPDWAQKAVPGTRGAWAPDISFFNGRHHLYYALSTFGSNRSVIALLTASTLDPDAPGYGWTDEGIVFESKSSDDFNAIDPNLLVDADGKAWLAFGSFWTGLKMIEIDPATGKPPPSPKPQIHALAERHAPDAVEASFLIRRGDFYYLFASYDYCCRGVDSSYYTVVGRATSPTGPFVDRDGKAMMKGGGFLVLHADLDRTHRFKGPGGISILRTPGRDFIVYHAYDGDHGGAPTLRIQPLAWTPDGWPVAV